MVRCMICGEDAASGWITGLPPAPDSQKVGLCRAHNTPGNRKKAEAQWRETLALAVENEQEGGELHRQAGELPLTLEILFIDGGRVEVPCKGFRAADQDILEVTTLENRLVFYPLRHIRRYGEK